MNLSYCGKRFAGPALGTALPPARTRPAGSILSGPAPPGLSAGSTDGGLGHAPTAGSTGGTSSPGGTPTGPTPSQQP